MLSVLLLGFAPDGRRAAAPAEAVRSLAALVPAAVDGLVRDLCFAGPDDRDLAQVADHAGCSFLAVQDPRAAFKAGARSLRAQHVLVMHAGTFADRSVLDEVASILPLLDPSSPAVWTIRAESTAFLPRLLPVLAPVAGLISSRAWLQAQDAGDLAGLVRRAKPVRVLKTTASRAT